MIRITLSSDAKGHGNSATLIASILRRTESPVHVRCWCRGYLPESFECGPLKVEFFGAEEEVTGRYPGHVNPAVFDRLRVIRDGTDWDRCLVLDHDMVVLCDLAPYFAEEFDGNLLMGRLFGPGNTLGLQMKQRGGLPESWAHAENHPYFFMGPMMNLAAMREEGIWDRLLEAHAAIGQDEQLSLTAACGGRTKGVGKKWNIVPQWDHLDVAKVPGDERVDVAGIPWRNGVPEGIIHWTGPSKPWHRGSKVWRADLWAAERATWEHLRMGIWEKPLVTFLEPEDTEELKTLATRGWKVRAFVHPAEPPPNLDQLKFPDLEVLRGHAERFQAAITDQDEVRLGMWSEVEVWFEGARRLPRWLVLKGEIEAAQADRVRGWGYRSEHRMTASDWPPGGPAARVLGYCPAEEGSGIGPGEWLYLSRTGPAEIDAGLRCGKREDRRAVAHAAKIGVIVFAWDKDRSHLSNCLKSIHRNFLSGYEVRTFVFTDGTVAGDVTVIDSAAPDETEAGMGNYARLIEEADRFDGLDYLFMLGAGTRVTGRVGGEILGEGLTAVVHAGFHDAPRSRFTYETRQASTAYVPAKEGDAYYTAAVQGGKKDEFLEAARQMAAAIAEDQRRGVTAVWRAESHWNRLLVSRPPAIALSPSYGRPAMQGSAFPARISLVPLAAET